jgi:hypothetical protein
MILPLARTEWMPAITTRTDLVIPAGMTAALDIPPLAVTDATTHPEWVEVPFGDGIYRRNPSQRLPLDPRTARVTRRYRRFAPWALSVTLILASVYFLALYRDDLPSAVQPATLALYLATMVGWNRVAAGLPRQRPRRLRSGELRIPEVPVEVAEQWVTRNPGVTTTDEPMPRPHSPRYYTGWAIGLVAAAITLFVVLLNDGREDFILFWMLPPVMVVAGVVMASRIRPPARDKSKYTLLD